MSESVLDVRNLQVQFTTENQPIIAVDDLTLTLKKGEKLGIVGESGSGKSVTSLGIMGLIPTPGKVTEGEIWLNPETDSPPVNLIKVNSETRRKYRGGEIAMIFQEPMSALNPLFTIGFQIIEAILQHQNISQTEAERKAIALLQEVRLLPSDRELREAYTDKTRENSDKVITRYVNGQKQEILKRYPHQLSGGQLQRVTIAMAISCNPRVLIADEPTTALDVTVQATILDLLRDLCSQRGMSLIFITHDLGVIAELVDTVVVMYRGEVVETGEIEEVFINPQHPYTKGLLACRPRIDRKLQILPTVSDFMTVTIADDGKPIIQEKDADLASMEEDIVTEEQQETRLSQLLDNEPLLSVKNLQVGFPIKGVFARTQDYFMAVKDISFNVYPGETLGLVGESGCGKSTLARAILRLIPSLGGDIIFEGKNLAQIAIGDRKMRSVRREIQIIFQNPYNSLNPRMTIGKAIAEPMKVHNTDNGKERKNRVAYLLERVGLNPQMQNRYPHEFSGGQRQRVCIARALALNPRFIICDESVSALDVSVQAQVLNLLKELQEEFGLTYIFISHDLSVVKFMSDRILVMNQGNIEEIDTAEEIYRSPKTEYTRQLIAAIPKGEFD
ncbi:Glutathione import ATP-binding protein GsiA [Hyella patelloides LEGE 07179]|uniref:Glutathione import ATP-binding protein GsiA n=1 Tax=Hyella patelloides LEGE 07179 TaxID=945734 RepID=A0A563VJ06_9CYAN|nr:ABC transporter ATP-binding protein [Hyella patelloides]VEP11389.1 Glutathione import ATP-binding protein GsiA [Hyella patelloides LEGE 07179]